MKKIFTFCFALLAGFTAFAQSNSVEFVDAAGNIIPSGRITVNYVYADPTGISNVNAPAEKEVVGYYTIGGQRIDKPQKGLTIIKYSDGTTKKKILR